MPQPSGGNDPPAEPEAFRLLAPQRGLIATEQKQTPCTAQRGPSRSHARRPEKAHCRNCQTATASPTEPGGLSCWASGDKRLKLARQHTETGNRRTPATAATGLPTPPQRRKTQKGFMKTRCLCVLAPFAKARSRRRSRHSRSPQRAPGRFDAGPAQHEKTEGQPANPVAKTSQVPEFGHGLFPNQVARNGIDMKFCPSLPADSAILS